MADQKKAQVKKRIIALAYTGGGFGGSLQGVPARGLTAAEVKEHGGEKYLISKGIYERVNNVIADQPAKDVSDG